jgi:predicted DNA repair protein MutK
LIILPIAFLLSAFLPIAVTIILVLGGLYLAFEGAEKIFEYILPHSPKHTGIEAKEFSESEILKLEKEKIKSAIVTDFILSVEIVIIALGTVLTEPLPSQIAVVSVVALLATVGVYGIVALIVRMDEFGLRLINLNERENSISDKIGRFFVNALPHVIKALSIIGTIALLLVAGGIFVHNVSFLHNITHAIPNILFEFIVGLISGFIVLFIIKGFKRLFGNKNN